MPTFLKKEQCALVHCKFKAIAALGLETIVSGPCWGWFDLVFLHLQ